MRQDSIGLFWHDAAKVVLKKEKIKKTPPDPVWLQPGYIPPEIPNLENYNYNLFTNEELANSKKKLVTLDIEVYSNYFLAAFRELQTGKTLLIETQDALKIGDDVALKWALENFTLITFNGNSYDLPLCAIALEGYTTGQIKEASDRIIQENIRGRDLLREHGTKAVKVDHIDLIEVAPLRASLKVYSGRLHADRMQDLPFHPSTILTNEQIDVVRWYCVNDLSNTKKLYHCLEEQIRLRIQLSEEYDTDMRSKSDAQIAEAAITSEIFRLNRARATRPIIDVGTIYRYQTPKFIHYKTELMKWALRKVEDAMFVVSEFGNISLPEELKELEIPIAANVYRMGIGGLHSSETCTKCEEGNDRFIMDRDVVSYYPSIILNLNLYPKHLGPNFLRVYNSIVQRRLKAKAEGNKVVADTLKITINGSFGKFGSPYSLLYAPDLLIQTTLTGQLSLLMLIEELELNGITVYSANTDGVVITSTKDKEPLTLEIIADWEKRTGFQTEETRYKAIYSRDVNNYIALKKSKGVKTKGAFNNPWAEGGGAACLHKNPTTMICVEAIQAYLEKRTPIRQTILDCNDVTKFVCVRAVKGGAVKDGRLLGKSIRWYYSNQETGEIVIAASGNKVPKSEGAKPLMLLTESLPNDIDYDWYVREAESILEQIGYNS